MNDEHYIFTLLRQDHIKIELLFEKLAAVSEGNGELRTELYRLLALELDKHGVAEEKAIYPTIKKHEKIGEIAFEGVEEHGVISYLLQKMDHLLCDTKHFSSQLTALKEVVEHHLDEEESILFPQMKANYSSAELELFAQEFLKAKGEHALARKAA